jgi:hypothetical protein
MTLRIFTYLNSHCSSINTVLSMTILGNCLDRYNRNTQMKLRNKANFKKWLQRMSWTTSSPSCPRFMFQVLDKSQVEKHVEYPHTQNRDSIQLYSQYSLHARCLWLCLCKLHNQKSPCGCGKFDALSHSYCTLLRSCVHLHAQCRTLFCPNTSVVL